VNNAERRRVRNVERDRNERKGRGDWEEDEGRAGGGGRSGERREEAARRGGQRVCVAVARSKNALKRAWIPGGRPVMNDEIGSDRRKPEN